MKRTFRITTVAAVLALALASTFTARAEDLKEMKAAGEKLLKQKSQEAKNATQ